MARKRTKTTWKQFDAADYIKTEKDIALYLDAVMEEAADDPALLTHALGDVARARRNMSQLARDAGVTREGLYKALSREGNPSFATVARIAKALGLELHFRPLKRRAALASPPAAGEAGPRPFGSSPNPRAS